MAYKLPTPQPPLNRGGFTSKIHTTMTNEALKMRITLLEITLLEKEFETKKKELIARYCTENNPYKIGDVFTDHQGSIKIERILHTKVFGKNDYCCEYYGIVLKKDGTETKNHVRRTAWQSNEVK